ncbi:Facilitated trehalose transporter Tret1 [Frankliniella fusca]|uniref:Facilitated trehalose transporter Tret1 n=1 Tax=Frankliniella fusca TaxID=407009 RepID=A0AAE1I5X6_9NEOP|nr:Facilitated trehalose transporter Tret1 [Frankliniella fusca]
MAAEVHPKSPTPGGLHDGPLEAAPPAATTTPAPLAVPTVGWRSVLCQCRAAAALMFQTLVQGMAQGWSSSGVDKLTHGEGPFPLAPKSPEVSLIVSLFELGLLIGSVVSLPVFTHLGRRHTLRLGALFFLANLLLTYFATSAGYLYAARLLSGAGMGVNFTYSSIYLGELATPLMRSVLILVMTILAPSGQLLSFLLAPHLDYWQLLATPAALLAVCVLLHLLWTPETPYFLTMHGRHQEAEKVLFRLRRGHDHGLVLLEVASIRGSVERQLSEAQSWRQTLSPPGVRRGALIVMVLSSSPALFGVTTVLSFTKHIFDVAKTPHAWLSSDLVIGVKIVMIFVAMFLVERLGRRVQLSVTAFINFAAMLAMSAYFLCSHLGVNVTPAEWVPLAALIVFMASTGAGVIPVSHILQGELLSQPAKAIFGQSGSALDKMLVAPAAAVVLSVSSFLIQMFFKMVGDSAGYYIPFGVYACTNLFIALFALLVVPETRGRTLVQVQDQLRARSLGLSASRRNLLHIH